MSSPLLRPLRMATIPNCSSSYLGSKTVRSTKLPAAPVMQASLLNLYICTNKDRPFEDMERRREFCRPCGRHDDRNANRLDNTIRLGTIFARVRGRKQLDSRKVSVGWGEAMIDGKCGILLDDRNKPRDSEQFFATLVDTFEKCDAQTQYLPGHYPVPRSDFREFRIRRTTLTDADGNDYSGDIVRFEQRRTPRFGAKQ